MLLKIAWLTLVVREQFCLTDVTLTREFIIMLPLVNPTIEFGKEEGNIIHNPPAMAATVEIAEVVFSTLTTFCPSLLTVRWTATAAAAWTYLVMSSCLKVYLALWKYSLEAEWKS